jgi:hypothetical protein
VAFAKGFVEMCIEKVQAQVQAQVEVQDQTSKKNLCDLAALRENKKAKSFVSHRVAFAKGFIEMCIEKVQAQVQVLPEVSGTSRILRSNFKKTFAT